MMHAGTSAVAYVVADAPARVVARTYALRALGLALGAPMVGYVLYLRGVPPVVIGVLVAVYGLSWPHIAYWSSLRSTNPVAADRRCVQIDAALGGAWVALMQFNVLPSALVVTMLGATVIALYGRLAFLGALGLTSVACAVTSAANGFRFAPMTDLWEMLAALPLLVVFPILLGGVTRRLSEHVRAQNRELARLGSLDSLSGLYNRRHWDDVVGGALAADRCRSATMLLIDIDHFKRVNDRHGHTVGDEVIRRVGAAIRSCLREGDVAGRYGGDEFCVILRDADLAQGARVAERIRVGATHLVREGVPDVSCTLSIGIARAPAGAGVVRDWVRAADAALYRAKLDGRDRLAVAH